MSSDPGLSFAVAHVAHAIACLAHDRNRSQVLDRGIAIGVHLQIINTLTIRIDEFVEHFGVALTLLPATSRDDQAFDVEFIGTDQQTDHRLFIIGIGSEVGGRDDAWLIACAIRSWLLILGDTDAGDYRDQESSVESLHWF